MTPDPQQRTEAGVPALPADAQIWLRIALTNLYARRRQQDTKANLLLSVNAVMLSLMASLVLPGVLEDTSHLVWALACAGATNLLSMSLAIAAMRPRVLGRGRLDPGALASHRASLLTFDDFYAMGREEYVDAVRVVLGRQDLIHETLTNEAFSVGQDLYARYRYLRLAYVAFVGGLVLSAILLVGSQLLAP